jgi:WD40 repeat protein
LQALENGLNESALRLAAAGALLANDLDMRLVPELWDTAVMAIFRSKTHAVLKGHISAFSPDGRRVATASRDKTARLWDAETGTEIAVLRGHENSVTSAAFSPDGRRVATASDDHTARSDDHTARLWDAETGTEIAVLRGHEYSVTSAAFSPDGKRVATVSQDKTARLWDAETGTEIAVLRGRIVLSVLSAAFSPDGRRVATASADGTARLWDAETGTDIAVVRGHENSVTSTAFSPDGRRVATASDDYTARLWDVSRSKVVSRGRALVLAAALAQGVGLRTANERLDFLMQDAPDDLYSAALALLGDRAHPLEETVAALNAPLHPNCYLSPTEFAAKFGLIPTNTDR